MLWSLCSVVFLALILKLPILWGLNSQFVHVQVKNVKNSEKRIVVTSSRSSGRVRGGARNMKSMRPNSAAIFFMTFYVTQHNFPKRSLSQTA